MNKRLLISGLIVIGGLPALGFLLLFTLQYGYCHGWWGKENFQFRSWWLCSCPAGFEQTLYPEHIEVMFSACDDVYVAGVPGGRYLFVRGDDSYPVSSEYLLDPLTSERIPFSVPPTVNSYDFLTHELLIVLPSGSSRRSNILSWRDGRSVPIDRLEPGAATTPSPYSSDGSLNPDMVALFQNAEQVFFFDNYTFAVVLVPDWWEHPTGNFTIFEGDFSGAQSGWLKAVVEANRIPSIEIERQAFSDELSSPDSRFIARPEGVYEATSDVQVAVAYQVDTSCPGCLPAYYPCCWLPDNSAVIYRFNGASISASGMAVSPSEVGAPKEGSPDIWMPVLKINLQVYQDTSR